MEWNINEHTTGRPPKTKEEENALKLAEKLVSKEQTEKARDDYAEDLRLINDLQERIDGLESEKRELLKGLGKQPKKR